MSNFSHFDTQFSDVGLTPPDGMDFKFTPDELREKMGKAAWQFEQAVIKLRQIEVSKNIREKKTMVILSSRRFDLIQNIDLRAHLIEIFEVDAKFRFTKELYENFIYLEHQIIFDEYNYYEKVIKQSSTEYDMWQRMLGYYQSMLKKDSAELYVLGTQEG